MIAQALRRDPRTQTASPVRRVGRVLAVAIGLGVAASTAALAQDNPRPKDDGIDSLLEKLTDPAGKADRPSKTEASDVAGKKADEKGSAAARPGKPEAQAPKTKDKGPDASSPLSGKDQEVDELLQKLGETTETPAPEDRRGGGAGDDKGDARGPAQKPQPNDRDRLSGKDKETDEHLEELTGRKRRKKGDDDERSGPAGQIIKEMRDIEQKLSKPDTGDATREEQKQVVKKIETMIEEAKHSGSSSMRRMMIRRVRQQGQQRPGGQQQGQTEGAMAGGVGPQKPKTPTNKHSTAGGKDVWGHLPPEMRADIDNMMNELPLATKQELVDRYYLSVGKGKPVREETP